VRKLSHTNITLLVLGCISVSIERPFIPDDWEYDLHVSRNRGGGWGVQGAQGPLQQRPCA
jgi:hypothetical protein